MSFFSFFFQNTVRLFPKRLNTKKNNCIKCAIAKYEHCKQNLQCTNNANNIREISLKKVLVIKLDTPKDFDKSTSLVLTYYTSFQLLDNSALFCSTPGLYQVLVTIGEGHRLFFEHPTKSSDVP